MMVVHIQMLRSTRAWTASFSLKMFLVMFTVLFCLNARLITCDAVQDTIILKDGSTINISLKGYDANTMAGQVLDNSSLLMPSSIVTININQIPPSVTFLVIQAHSFSYSVTLSYQKELLNHSFLNGTNIGLVQFTTNINTAQFFLFNSDLINNISVLVAVQGYGKDAPVPGGCNMEFPVETAPYLGVGYNESIVWVDSPPPAPPGAGPRSCEMQQTEVETYHMFLPERDFSSEIYFQALRMMMTVHDIRENGRKVDAPLQGPHMRRVYSSYPGTGSVYAAIAVSGFSGAAYVPALTYSCSIAEFNDSCEVLTTTLGKVVCATALFLGLFICFFGHRFFKTGMFLLGFLDGALLTYILGGVMQGDVDVDANIGLSVGAGLLVGVVWLLFWFFCGIPVLSVLPAMLTLGYIVAAIIMFAGVGDIQIFESDFNFWILFICVALTMPIIMLSDSRMANIVCCGVLGAYAVVVPIDHYIGSNLKYILLNTIRRATVRQFKTSVIDPPFQTRDVILCAVWFGLASLGITFQWYQERMKPPFPAPHSLASQVNRNQRRFPRRRVPRARTDRSPLLSDSRHLYGSTSLDDDSVYIPPPSDRRFNVLPKGPTFPSPTAPSYAYGNDQAPNW